jgi:hypothetical protein
MALIRADLTMPSVAEMFPLTRRRRVVRPCGTAAAYRRHYRRGGDELPVDEVCAAWHRKEQRSFRKAKRKRNR